MDDTTHNMNRPETPNQARLASLRALYFAFMTLPEFSINPASDVQPRPSGASA